MWVESVDNPGLRLQKQWSSPACSRAVGTTMPHTAATRARMPATARCCGGAGCHFFTFHTKTYKCFSFILGHLVGPCCISTRRHVNQRPGGTPSRGYARPSVRGGLRARRHRRSSPARPAHPKINCAPRAGHGGRRRCPPALQPRLSARLEARQWMHGLRNPLGQAVSQPSCASGHLVPCTMRLRGGPEAHTSRSTPQGPHSKGKSARQVPAEPLPTGLLRCADLR